jgi:hypothetical protein
LRLNFFDNDAFPAFNRFHITQIFRFNFAFPWYSCSPHVMCVYIKLKETAIKKMHTEAQTFAGCVGELR